MDKKIDLLNPETNEVVKEVREIRYKISENCGHDLYRLLAHYQEVGRRLRETGKYKFAETQPPIQNPTPPDSSSNKAAD
ncbi:MAG: hypothetical protein OXD54_10830 [Candidatus Poribacteria bacterium]|nr:hypothetical protein [Candidatus Poribacteria bacterium]